ncbi:MAG TPA: hypothetical protein VLS53_00080 [Candidatus Dormibacteraeota bacterium]|nr:hypothetical protein [Candidatus Dormibacteraeota bacterium]
MHARPHVEGANGPFDPPDRQVSESAGGGAAARELAFALVAAVVDTLEGSGYDRLQFGYAPGSFFVFRIHSVWCSDVY